MNSKDPFAVAVVKSQVAVGHIPRKISSICSMFLRHGGTICCRVTGSRRYSQDLPQGGLEIPCMLTFRGEAKDIDERYGRPKFWRRVIFAVLSQSAKSAKVMRLENTALYGI